MYSLDELVKPADYVFKGTDKHVVQLARIIVTPIDVMPDATCRSGTHRYNGDTDWDNEEVLTHRVMFKVISNSAGNINGIHYKKNELVGMEYVIHVKNEKIYTHCQSMIEAPIQMQKETIVAVEEKIPVLPKVENPVSESVPSATAWMKDHIQIVHVGDTKKKKVSPVTETVESIKVPEVSSDLHVPIITRDSVRRSLKGLKGCTIYDSPYCVWVAGNTYPVRATIKANGGKWSPNKKQWFFTVDREV